MSAGRDFMNPEWVDKVMAQVQVYASAWSLVGGRFDSGDMIETAAEEKAALLYACLRCGSAAQTKFTGRDDERSQDVRRLRMVESATGWIQLWDLRLSGATAGHSP